MTPFIWLLLIGIAIFYTYFYPTPVVLELSYCNFIYDVLFKPLQQLHSFHHLAAKQFPPYSVIPALLLSIPGKICMLGNCIPMLEMYLFQGVSREQILLRITKLTLVAFVCWSQARFVRAFHRSVAQKSRLFPVLAVLFHVVLYYAEYPTSKLMRNTVESALLLSAIAQWLNDRLLACFAYLIGAIVFVDVKMSFFLALVVCIEICCFKGRRVFVCLAKASLPLALCLLTSLAVDSFAWKKPVIPSLTYAKYQFARLNQSKINALPWNWYFVSGIFDVLSALAPFIPLGLFAGRKALKVGGAVALYFAFFSTFPQKKRYMLTQWTTLFICYASAGLLLVRRLMLRSKVWYLLLLPLVGFCAWQTAVKVYTTQRIDPFVEAIQHPVLKQSKGECTIYIHPGLKASSFELSALGNCKVVLHNAANYKRYYEYDWVITREPKLFSNAFQIVAIEQSITEKKIGEFVNFFRNRPASFWFDLLSRGEFWKSLVDYESVVRDLKENSVYIMSNTLNKTA